MVPCLLRQNAQQRQKLCCLSAAGFRGEHHKTQLPPPQGGVLKSPPSKWVPPATRGSLCLLCLLFWKEQSSRVSTKTYKRKKGNLFLRICGCSLKNRPSHFLRQSESSQMMSSKLDMSQSTQPVERSVHVAHGSCSGEGVQVLHQPLQVSHLLTQFISLITLQEGNRVTAEAEPAKGGAIWGRSQSAVGEENGKHGRLEWGGDGRQDTGQRDCNINQGIGGRCGIRLYLRAKA